MNPYAPPSTKVDDLTPAKRRPVAFIVLGLSVLQLLWLMLYLSGYWELVRTGAVSALAALAGFLGCALLYAGSARFTLDAAQGRRLFIAAIVLLVLSLRGWGLAYVWSYPYVLATVIAVVGAWFSGRGAAK